jgi:putative DNA primase/helicase
MTSTFEQACPEADEEAEREAKKAKKNGGIKPVLLIDQGELPTVAENLRNILASSGALFDRGVPVRIVKPADSGLPIAVALTTHGVVRMSHVYCRPMKNGENATLPDRVAGLYLDMSGEWGLPKLVGITSSPLLSEDGGIRTGVGYDRHAGLYCCNVPKLVLPDRPSKEDAAAGLTTLRKAFRTFPFADSARRFDADLNVEVVDLSAPIGMDESGFLNGLLTAVCRQSLSLAPGLLLNAPQISGAGSGKGLLARAISAIAYAVRPKPFTPGNDKHEMDKRLVAEVMEGGPSVFMDNVNGTLLRSNTLASLITERPSGVRELGKSRMIKLEHASFVILTGNGLTVSEDLARRFISSQLDPCLEDPEVRPFKPGFLDQIECQRPELLAAALTVWRWGRQNELQAGITLGSFETWGTWVRDPLLALGCRDPVEQIKEIKARDPQRQRVAELFELWWENHGDAPTKASEIADELKVAIDPQGRGRQFIAKAVEDLAGTRQAGFVLTRAKGAGRKAVATYALKKALTQGDGAGRHPPCPPYPCGGRESSRINAARGCGEWRRHGVGTPASTEHTMGMPGRDGADSDANTMGSGKPPAMSGMGGMPSDMARDGPPFVACDFCGKPADHQPLSQVADGRRMGQLHRRCEDPWLHMSGGNGAPQSDLDGDKASEQPDAIILIRQIRVPAISASPDDDIEDIIDPRWRR